MHAILMETEKYGKEYLHLNRFFHRHGYANVETFSTTMHMSTTWVIACGSHRSTCKRNAMPSAALWYRTSESKAHKQPPMQPRCKSVHSAES